MAFSFNGNTPKVITFNNQDVKKLIFNNNIVWQKSGLPSEYEELEYIESTGTQYIDTGITCNTSNVYWETKFLITKMKGTSNTNYNQIIGQNGYPQIGVSSTQWTVGNSSSSEPFEPAQNTIYTATLSKDGLGSLYINDEPTNLRRAGTVSRTKIFSNENGGAYAKIYYVKFVSVSTNEVLNYFIPCYRKSDNVAGLYDKVTNTFYINSGKGEFIKGYK